MTESRIQELGKIAAELRDFKESPLYEYRIENDYLPVIGSGDPNAAIMFIGEAPGENEAESGQPFVGAAGRVLDELLASIGLKRENVYITNIVKDRPPKNRDPRPVEVELYAPFLERQIAIIQPEVIATLGRFSMEFVLDLLKMPQLGQKIGDLHGQQLEGAAGYGKVTVVPLYHPASGFYNRSLRAAMEEDVLALKPFVK
ncbi:MAG TPA: uracil-DNA glycosylase [Aggregatilinea sp.]|jgi:DNA polymerase|uniref:uracil-DNA glycosylase n=1 Tax=Aggregatilinea sp. TaxID=2806333 RepID=UPI002C7F7865|nr:uracil-DNA glycosylase [Aggregatilinea sp.]HML21537.1 uracil-DNA glycosylase [Aggregatilinea sp.]